nr:hypothetical protein [Streptomyces sp. DSM 40713]
MDVIIQTGFPRCFPVVADFIMWAKNQGVAVGPGRASAAGSIVAEDEAGAVWAAMESVGHGPDVFTANRRRVPQSGQSRRGMTGCTSKASRLPHAEANRTSSKGCPGPG